MMNSHLLQLHCVCPAPVTGLIVYASVDGVKHVELPQGWPQWKQCLK